jgi:hypothetical protein
MSKSQLALPALIKTINQLIERATRPMTRRGNSTPPPAYPKGTERAKTQRGDVGGR